VNENDQKRTQAEASIERKAENYSGSRESEKKREQAGGRE